MLKSFLILSSLNQLFQNRLLGFTIDFEEKLFRACLELFFLVNFENSSVNQRGQPALEGGCFLKFLLSVCDHVEMEDGQAYFFLLEHQIVHYVLSILFQLSISFGVIKQVFYSLFSDVSLNLFLHRFFVINPIFHMFYDFAHQTLLVLEVKSITSMHRRSIHQYLDSPAAQLYEPISIEVLPIRPSFSAFHKLTVDFQIF